MDDTRQRIAEQVLRRYRSGQMSRREAVRLLGALGLTTAGIGAIGLGAINTGSTIAGSAASGGVHAGHGGLYAALLRQDAGTPAAAATPTLGEQPDGTHVWKVKVAGLDEENLIDTQSFFPKEITINAGDAIYFEFPTPPGFHTVTFLSGGEVPPLIIPDESAEASEASPAAGPPTLIINPEAAFPSGSETYDGTGFVNSGLDVVRLPGDPPFVLTFTTPGTYEYQCIPHGVVMKATVVVQDAGSELPEDQAAIDARAQEERAALIEEGKAEIAEYQEATATTREDGSTLWEIAAGAGEGQARVMQFLPNTVEIKAGDTVRWVNHSKTEPHTVTFLGSGVEQPEDISVEPQPGGPPTIIQNPMTLFPQGEPVYSGEGYVNSGFLGELNGEPLPGGPAFELTFDTAGEYPYYCILHASGPEGPGMAGTITVT
ncbi:MAG TPA: plastocyanin/azurin family copper-binding protein [Thermomicrobiales bacterium]|nr:plastocyanin/azurin family copper-binding protein [Thermomicrobiales bacterium]